MDKVLYWPFIDSTANVIFNMTGVEVAFEDEVYEQKGELRSFGLTYIIDFSGSVSGRFAIDMEPRLAINVANNITGESYDNIHQYKVFATISKLSSIIADEAIGLLEEKCLLKIFAAPPVIFTECGSLISIKNMPSISIDGSTAYGSIRLNIAME
ncbi:MAG: chemotaxis protein CheX [Xylanivirga thermophila]|uniref:chemotaxis protein CheX n=1 Tax=Xylanivirga thermophila TaxID=2496273 RepID=UPI00101BBD63|nr:chemotaxis protein CheX [Xylanivirga thermophila]